MEALGRPATREEHQQALFLLLQELDRVCRTLEIPYVLYGGTLLGAIRHGDFIPWDDDADVLLFREDYERLLAKGDAVLDGERFFLQKEFSPHYPMFFSKLRLNHTACLEKYHPRDPQCHQGVYLDIFPCDSAAGTPLGRKFQFYCSKVVIAHSLHARGYETQSLWKKLALLGCSRLPLRPFLWVVRRGSADSPWVHSFLGGASAFAHSCFPRAYLEKRIPAAFHGGSFPVPAAYDALLQTLYGDYRRLPSPEERRAKEHALLVDLHHSYEEYAHYRDGQTFETLTRSIR